MYPSAWRIRASSTFSFDAGASTCSWPAAAPLRIRVKKSAIGSVSILTSSTWSSPESRRGGRAGAGRSCRSQSPCRPPGRGRSGCTGSTPWSCTSALASALPAKPFLPSALTLLLFEQTLELRWPPAAGERHPQAIEEGKGLRVGLGAGGDRDLHPPDVGAAAVVDLREDRLLPHPHRVVAAAVEGAGRQPPEVADPGDRDRAEPVEELVGAVAAQRDRDPHRHPLAHLESGDRLAGPAHGGELAGD